MKSRVFSVLKIVAVAMMLVWALQPTAARAGDGCTLNGPYYYGSGFGLCMNDCQINMGYCTEWGNGGCYYWRFIDGTYHLACGGGSQCVSDLYACFDTCANYYAGCPGDPGPIW